MLDVHAHLVPEAALAEAADHPSLVPYDPDSRRLDLPSGPSRPVPRALTDLDAARARVDAWGVSFQVLSPWLDLTDDGLAPERSEAWCRVLNDAAAEAIRDDERFGAFAALPLVDGDRAAAELRRAVEELGFLGAIVDTQVRGHNLHEAGLDPLFEAASALDVVLFVHPYRVLGAERLGWDFMTNICGNPFETTVAALSLFGGGVFERFGELKVLLAHAGGTLPYLAGRAARGSHLPLVSSDPVAADEILGRFTYDTVLHDPAALAFTIERLGADRMVLGSDAPFPMGLDDPVGHVRDACEGSQDAFDRITEGSARRLLGR